MSAKPRITGLLYPQMKIERAAFHLKELSKHLEAFRANPYTILENDDLERGLHRILVFLNPAERDIPVLVGEIAYLLRHALDQLAWQLGLLSGRLPNRSSAFPIQATDARADRENFMLATWHIPCEAIDVIKSVQPYQRGKDFKLDPLWRLNKLCNLDKHVTVGYSNTEVSFTFMLLNGAANPPYRIHEDTGAVEVLIPAADKDNIKIKYNIPAQKMGKPIELGGELFELTEADITEICRYVKDDVLPKFAKFFPTGSSLWPPMIDGKPA
jgi:hypothetical protein